MENSCVVCLCVCAYLGWEVPAGYDWHHLPPRPANVALWRKKQELQGQDYNYLMGEAMNIVVGTHVWYHGQAAHHDSHGDEDPGMADAAGHGSGHH